jgi:hypothetical protein
VSGAPGLETGQVEPVHRTVIPLSQKAATLLTVRFGAAGQFNGSFPAVNRAAAVSLREYRMSNPPGD